MYVRNYFLALDIRSLFVEMEKSKNIKVLILALGNKELINLIQMRQ